MEALRFPGGVRCPQIFEQSVADLRVTCPQIFESSVSAAVQPGEEVPDGEHGAGLAATEVGLQVDHQGGGGVPCGGAALCLLFLAFLDDAYTVAPGAEFSDGLLVLDRGGEPLHRVDGAVGVVGVGGGVVGTEVPGFAEFGGESFFEAVEVPS